MTTDSHITIKMNNHF